MPLTPIELLAAIAIVTVAATVQAAVGIGLGLIAAPLLLLINPSLVPAPLMTTGVLLSFFVAIRDHQGIDFTSLKFALIGRIFGIIPAAVLLSMATQRIFDLTFASLVLLAVLLSALGLSVTPTISRSVIAGAVSGFMGTISGIGGPPIALLYQHSKGPKLRGTLSSYFCVGATLSLITLAVIGRFGVSEIVLALLLLPGILLGFVLSKPLASRLDKTSVRPIILGLSFASAIAVLLKAIA